MKSTLTVVTLGALFFAGASCSKKAGPPPMMTPEVAVVTVEPERIEIVTELTGRTVPHRIAEIRPQVSGVLLKRLFEEGAQVEEGQVLYQIDPAMYEATLGSAEASLARAEAAAVAVKLRAERVKELIADKAISQQDYDDAQAAATAADAEILFTKAAVAQARINLDYTQIKAPIGGRIGKSNVTEGAMVTAYQPVPLAVIQQLDPMYVDVPQSSIEMLRAQRQRAEGRWAEDGGVARPVSLVLPDGTAYAEQGTMQFQDITVNPATGTLGLRALFPNPAGALLPGMFVRARVTEGVSEAALLVPQQGVQRDPRGDSYVLLVTAEDTVQAQPVVIDRAVDNRWLITSGLKAGDRVIVEGSQKARPGAPVRVVAYQPGAPVASAPPAAGP